jgi:hypothetical protein
MKDMFNIIKFINKYFNIKFKLDLIHIINLLNS